MNHQGACRTATRKEQDATERTKKQEKEKNQKLQNKKGEKQITKNDDTHVKCCYQKQHCLLLATLFWSWCSG